MRRPYLLFVFLPPLRCLRSCLSGLRRGRFAGLAIVLLGAICVAWAPAACAAEVTFGNELISVIFHTDSALFTVTDMRNGRVWEQDGSFGAPAVVEAQAGADGASMTASLWDGGNQLQLQLHAVTPTGAAEVACEISSAGPMARCYLCYPVPFRTQAGDFLVAPMGEGIMYPADDATVEEWGFPLYCGWRTSMPWSGVCHGENGPGVMTIIETPNDACFAMNRAPSGLLELYPRWRPERADFGYTRAFTYAFTTSGGYVSQAKRYRQYAQQTGLFKSLAQKRSENPNVDLLIGAANVWAPWFYPGNDDPVGLASEMQSLGIARILYSDGNQRDATSTLNAMPGVLTGTYELYPAVWPPGQPDDAPHEGWPEDLVWQSDGSILPGWVIVRDGTSYPGGLVCTPRQVEHAQARIPADLAATPYRARFLDTTCCMPWQECYNPDHPTTRTEDCYWRMELLRYVSEDMGMVTGTESGIDPSVPYTHYYEGMLSLGPYRLGGEDPAASDPPTPEFLKYQVGPYYRIPLWELVYHDCTVAMWYWGDSSNKAPEVWDQRDLINVLYGTPPLFMITPEIWSAHKTRFAQSYRTTCPAARTLGYDEMVSHEFLTEDHTLQRTTWSSGTTIAVNFADHAQNLPDGATVGPMGYLVRPGLFFDVPPDHWAFAYINACHNAGIVGGYSDGTYRPTERVDRASMAVYISRALAGGDEYVPTGPATATFPDVLTDHWAFKYVEYAVAEHIVVGYDDGTYRPDVQVDRGQMAVFVARALVTPSGDAGVPDPPETSTFPDVTSTNSWAWCYPHVEFIAAEGVTQGYDDGKYHPEGIVTRDQMAVYVQRAFELPT